MIRTDLRLLCLLALLPPMALGACHDIPTASADRQRAELELDVAVEPPFLQALQDPDAALRTAIEAAILGEADVGLRFYPVPARDYAEGQQRPAYRMAVRVRALDLDLLPGKDGAPPQLQRLAAAVAVALEKRRTNAPALLVAQSAQTMPGPTALPAAQATEASYSIAGAAPGSPQIARESILEAVRSGFRESVRRILPAIDREFAPPPGERR